MNSKEKKLEAFSQLLDIMDELREKCPWDKKQTFKTLRHLTLEEVYELSDAIVDDNLNEIKKELGDVLLHLVFYSKIGEEKENFDIADVIENLNAKLIHRHPHIYGDVKVKNEEEVKRNWEELKLKEGKKSILEGVPKSLPALIKAYRIQEKVKGVGFEFENPQQTWDKVKEELLEFEAETNSENQEKEFGDLLFSLINYARFMGINPEDALEKTNKKFISRFKKLEQLALQKKLSLHTLSLTKLDALWVEAKQYENKY